MISLNSMAKKIAFILVQREIVQNENLEIYKFGFELLLATALNGLIVLAASIVMNVFWQSLLLLIPFMLIRSNAGGFHANSHVSCMIIFLTVYIAGVQIVKHLPFHITIGTSYVSVVVATAIILMIGALPHENRPVSATEVKMYKRKARFLSMILLFVGLTGQYLAPRWFAYYSLGLVIAAGSLLVGYLIKNVSERRSEHDCG